MHHIDWLLYQPQYHFVMLVGLVWVIWRLEHPKK